MQRAAVVLATPVVASTLSPVASAVDPASVRLPKHASRRLRGRGGGGRCGPLRRLSPLCLTCDVTRFDAEEVVEGEGGLIHSFPYTCI